MLIEHGPNKEEPWFSEASHQNFDISEIFTVKCFLKFNFILPFFFSYSELKFFTHLGNVSSLFSLGSSYILSIFTGKPTCLPAFV